MTARKTIWYEDIPFEVEYGTYQEDYYPYIESIRVGGWDIMSQLDELVFESIKEKLYDELELIY